MPVFIMLILLEQNKYDEFILICDIFSILNTIDFTNYADDTTSYVIGDRVKEAIDSLKNALDKLFCWFASNQMKTNRGKCLITSCDNEIGFSVISFLRLPLNI